MACLTDVVFKLIVLKLCLLFVRSILLNIMTPPNYSNKILYAPYGRLSSLSTDALPTKVTAGQYASLFYEEWECNSSNIEQESVLHILLKCPVCTHWWLELIRTLFSLKNSSPWWGDWLILITWQKPRFFEGSSETYLFIALVCKIYLVPSMQY